MWPLIAVGSLAVLALGIAGAIILTKVALEIPEEVTQGMVISNQIIG
jgi:hypothetical protein